MKGTKAYFPSNKQPVLLDYHCRDCILENRVLDVRNSLSIIIKSIHPSSLQMADKIMTNTTNNMVNGHQTKESLLGNYLCSKIPHIFHLPLSREEEVHGDRRRKGAHTTPSTKRCPARPGTSLEMESWQQEGGPFQMPSLCSFNFLSSFKICFPFCQAELQRQGSGKQIKHGTMDRLRCTFRLRKPSL